MPIEFDHDVEPGARIKVIGVGGGGGNAVANMIQSRLEGVEFIVANTDAQVLASHMAPVRIQMGENVTRGLGAGARPDVGKRAAEESRERIKEVLANTDMAFITAGMGGGTGTGAAPVIAQVAKEMDILTVAVVTRPFNFEGKKRMTFADEGLEELRKHVDTIITIPNQKLLEVADKHTTFLEAFKMADEVLHQAVRGITDLINVPGLINLDFADVRTVMAEMGLSMMGTGEASGEDRALEAAKRAVASPLLADLSIEGAKGVLINITGGYDLTIQEIDEAAMVVRDLVDDDANIVFGAVLDPAMSETMRVTLVATGIGGARMVQFPGNAKEAKLGGMGGGYAQAGGPAVGRRMPEAPVQRVAEPPPPPPMAEPTLPRSGATPPVAPVQGVPGRRNVLGGFNGTLDDANSEESFDVPTFLRRQIN